MNIFLLVSFFLIFFGNLLAFLVGGWINYVDELLIVIVFLNVAYRAINTGNIKKSLFLLFLTQIIFFIISLPGANFKFENIVIQDIVHIKFFLIFYLVYIQFRGCSDQLRLYFSAIFVITLIGLLTNILVGESFYRIFNLDIRYRASIPRLVGFQLQSNFLSYMFEVYYVYLTLFDIRNISLRKYVFITVIFFFLLLAGGSRTTLLVFPVTGFYYFRLHFKKKIISYALAAIGLICFSGALLLFGSHLIAETKRTLETFSSIDDTLYIRAIMIYYGVVLSLQHFPIGAGSASFGSFLSAGSTVYENLGISNLHFFEEMRGVYDSNIATILGEFGAVGILIYVFLLSYIYKEIISAGMLNRIGKAYYKVLIILMVILSVKSPVFVHGYTSLLFAIALNIRPQQTWSSFGRKTRFYNYWWHNEGSNHILV